MLARMQRKRISLAQLVGMQTGVATLENSMEVLQKIKNRTTLSPNNCTTRYLSKGYRCAVSRDTCNPMFIAALSTIAKVWKEPKCPSMDEWIKKIWYIYIQWSITRQPKRMKSCHLQLRGWNWRVLCHAKLVSQRKTNIIQRHAYEDFKIQNR